MGYEEELYLERTAKRLPAGKGFRKGNKLQINVMICEALLDATDEEAVANGESRSATVRRALSALLSNRIKLKKL